MKKLSKPAFFFSLWVAGLSSCYAQSGISQLMLGCILEPSQKVAISSPVDGVIELLPVQRGQQVEKGQMLFQLRSGVQAAAVELAQVKADFAERNAKRNATLYEDELLSSYERDEIETESLIARTELKAMQEELAMRKIVSPTNGVIIDKFSDVGEYVTNEPVLEIAVLDPLYAEVLMPFERFNEFSVGDTLTIRLAAPVSGTHQAIITIVDPIIDSASGTFRLRLRISNANHEIPAGVVCEFGA